MQEQAGVAAPLVAEREHAGRVGFDHLEVAPADLQALLARADDPLRALTNAELADTIHRAVRALPPRCREVWELSRNHGLGYEEIAGVTGVSVNTVKTQMARALRALREALVPFLGASLLFGVL